ncbi:MAG: PH domain-containing protein [Candidatus Brocadia sp.]|nr:MAG: PH domain-containing protein [Candidatus Brocadia sp.]
MTNTNALQRDTVFHKATETEIVQSFKPRMCQNWFVFAVSSFAIFLALTKFGVATTTGLSMVSVSSLLILYYILSVCTTTYIITHRGILFRKGPFSRALKEVTYGDINNILVIQGSVQRRFKIGNLMIGTNQASYVFRGIKHPHKTKELINKEKFLEHERRTLLRKTL